ncbi:MAG: LCP family protein, partial [Lachnospiraceae bacterium]|nr:LCP family protein [Lachnospiraceae bacterium]
MRREANSDRIQNRRRAQSLRSELREDPEAYFERVQERKARAAEDEYRHRHKAKQVRSYREEKRDYERSKQAHRYLPEKDFYEEDLVERRARMQRQLRQQQKASGKRQRRAEEEIPVRTKKRKKGKAKRIFIGIVVFLLLLVIGAGVVWFTPSLKKPVIRWTIGSPFGPALVRMFIGSNYESYVRDKSFSDKNVRINEGASTPKGNLSFAMIGVDARDEDLTIGTMADSMIVVNVTPDGNIRMGSIYRDTYLMSRTKDGEEIISKANSAYYRGGPLGTINLMNENFDLALKDYIVVIFSGLTNIIDLLGGLRLKVTEIERDTLNYHMYEQNEYAGTEYIPLEEYGDDVLLTGSQATAFCRLRSCSFDSPVDGQTYYDDYARTARQRYALMELVRQTKDKGILNLLKIMNQL